jgi:hypothetical protein
VTWCVGDGSEAGEDVEAEVAAAFAAFVVSFGQHGADRADEGVAVGGHADDVGAPANLAVEPLGGVVRPDLPPDLPGEGAEGEHVGPGGLEVLGHPAAVPAVRPSQRGDSTSGTC